MRTSYILEWIKRAYPEVKKRKTPMPGNESIFYYSLSGSTIDLVVNTGLGEIEFPLLGKPRDIGKLKLFAGALWGSPRETGMTDIDSWTPGGPKRKVSPLKNSQSLGNSLGQKEILRYLIESIPKEISYETLPSGAIRFGSDGPVLGRFGLSPSPKETHHYIPYGHSERIKEVLTKYLKECFSIGQQ